MIYTVLTLFPQLLEPWCNEALLGRAVRDGLIDIRVRNLRDVATDKHKTVDDTPYGGGAGMVIRVDIVARALESVQQTSPPLDEVILLTPAGEPLTQSLVEDLAQKQHLCLLSGRYEGFDARVEPLVTREISIGDYVLMGGELAALALIEATARLQPGVLGDANSHQQDSHSTGLLDYPEYTRPATFAEATIPDVLISGHHANISRWRREQALLRTLQRRPDMLSKAPLTDDDKAFLATHGFQVDESSS
ncbi:MAG: tRNA (guanosine(37)-N1)-methyltransferase TrmD [Deinococcota bacterium]